LLGPNVLPVLVQDLLNRPRSLWWWW